MKDVSVIKIRYKERFIYNSFLNSIYKYNKYFNLETADSIFIINNGSIDIGVLLVKYSEENLPIISLHQAPNVCKLSIISLIESAILLSKKYYNKDKSIIFNMKNASSYLFKFKLIFNKYELIEDNLIVDIEEVNNTPDDKITFRNISFLDL